MFASTYKITTAPEPIKSARTRFRPGSRTSLPRNVTFVQAVWAKIGPTIDLPRSRMIASPPTNLNPGCATCGLQPLADEFHHADVRAPLVALQPRKPPTTTTPASADVFANIIDRPNCPDEDAQQLSEQDRDNRDGSGLNDQKQSPAVQKSHGRAISCAKENVNAARARHHCRQFGAAKRACDREQTGERPC